MAFAKDLDRINEERAGIARPAPATLAPAHLVRALDAFDDACTPEAVLTPRRTWPLQPGDPPAAWRTLAEITQAGFCCTSTLFTAFAAEAFVNDFLRVHLKPKVTEKRFKQIDRRWSTVRKYTDAVREAYDQLFWQGDEVIPALDELFTVRNQLVHPRPGLGPPMAHMPDRGWRELYPPAKVAEWLVAVSGAAEALERRCYGFDYVSAPASAIWHGRHIVLEHASHPNPLPDMSRAGSLSLIQLLYAEEERASHALQHVRLTVDELRDARLTLASKVGPWDIFTDLAARQAAREHPELSEEKRAID